MHCSWGSPAPIYVRFAIPRTEKRQCLCSGSSTCAATQYTYTLHMMPTAAAARRQVRAWTVRNFAYGFPYQQKVNSNPHGIYLHGLGEFSDWCRYMAERRWLYQRLVVHGYDMKAQPSMPYGRCTIINKGMHSPTATERTHAPASRTAATGTGNCSGGKATSTEKAICETCHTAYGELLQLTKTVITTPPTLPSEGYVGDQYLDGDLKGGEAKVEGTDIVVPGSFRFKHNWGGVVDPGENPHGNFTPAE